MVVVDSTAAHVRELRKTLRLEDRLESMKLRVSAETALFNCYRKAVYRKTAIINGKVAAMWGVGGTLLGYQGTPYLMTSNEVYKVSPLQFMRIYKHEVEIMTRLFPRLESFVDAEYRGAVKALRLAGFTLSEKIKLLDGYVRHFILEVA